LNPPNLLARERDLINKKKKETEQESFDKFLKYLETDSEAKEAFKKLADEYVKCDNTS
jgi:hypothetical protein